MLWRPYFIVLEDANKNLIFTITENGIPNLEDQSNLCPEDIFLIEDIALIEAIDD